MLMGTFRLLVLCRKALPQGGVLLGYLQHYAASYALATAGMAEADVRACD